MTRRPPGHLGAMYMLLFVLLAAVGLNAGWVATMAYRIGGHPRFRTCMADAGTSWPAPDLTAAEATRDELGRCLRPVTMPWALLMIGGAVAAYGLTVLLTVAGSVRTRRLVRADRVTGPVVAGATARFAELCRTAGPAGQDPRLHVLRPGARFSRPFTIGGPGRRSAVVIPAAVACAGPGVLEPVLRHELAHVRARDALLAAGAWWSGWAGVLLSLLAAAPFLIPGRRTAPGYGTGLLVAVTLSALLLVLRAHVLRLRELEADRAAAAGPGRGADLAGLLRAAPSRARRSPLSVHPGADARIRALRTPVAPADGGFLPSAVTALVLFIAVQPVHQVAQHRIGWAGGAPWSLFALAGGLLVVLLAPAWARRYADHPNAPWWPPVTGVAAGGAAGFFLPGPGLPVSPGTLALDEEWRTAPLLMLALAGTAVILIGLCQGGHHRLLPVTAAGAGFAAVVVPSAVQGILTWTGGLHPTFLRLEVLYGIGPVAAEPVLVFAALTVLAVVAARSAPRPRLPRRPVVALLIAVATVAVAGGAVMTVLREPAGGDRVAGLPLLWHRWWVSALAGAVVLVVLLGRSAVGRPAGTRVAGALAAAAGVTVVSAAGQFTARLVTTGWDPAFHPWLLGQYVIVPLRILLLLSVVVVPVALVPGLIRRRDHPRAPAGSRGSIAVFAAVVVTAGLSVAAMAGAGEALTGGVPDARRVATP